MINRTPYLSYTIQLVLPSWASLAGPYPAEVYEPASRNRNAAYS
jgi:hypothetical protein